MDTIGSIHPTAIVDPKAQVDPSCVIGPYAVIDKYVTIGARCWIGPYVHITGSSKIDSDNRFHAACIIGDAPQDLKYKGELTGLRIGPNNVFREHVTVNRATTPEHDTIVGSTNFLMAGCHVAHDCELANQIVIANGALLGGHVQVGERVLISGNCLVHQFVRVGTLAMMQGGSAISKDLPPFTVARGDNGISGLNTVGLRRAGYDSASRLELRRLYQALFRGVGKWADRLAQAEKQFTGEAALTLIAFVKGSKRGICTDRGQSISDEGDNEV